MHDRSDHPCLRCILPDCDDKNLQCELRKALNDYKRHQRLAEPMPPEIKRAYAIAFRELRGLARDVRRAEARMGAST